MTSATLSRAFVQAPLSLFLFLAACGRVDEEVHVSWAQVGDAALLHGSVTDEVHGWRSGYVIARQPGQPLRVVYAWIGRLAGDGASYTRGRGLQVQFRDGVGTFEEQASCQGKQVRFSGTVAWDAAQRQLVETLDVDGKHIDFGGGRVFAIDWRADVRTSQLSVDLPAPTDDEQKGDDGAVAMALAKKYVEFLQRDPKVLAFLAAK